MDPLYSASPARIRQLAAKTGFVSEIHSRDGEEEARDRCPVCGSKLKKVKSLTLWGKKVTTGFACTVCPYRTGKKKQIPTRYIFHLK
jgi:C4-type Zn-finger protein